MRDLLFLCFPSSILIIFPFSLLITVSLLTIPLSCPSHQLHLLDKYFVHQQLFSIRPTAWANDFSFRRQL